MSKCKALILGTSASAIGIYNAAIEFGCDVIVAGNKVHDPLVGLAGSANWLKVDYSTEYDLILRELDAGCFDAVIPSANDASYRMGLAISCVRPIPGYDSKQVADGISYKHLFPRLVPETSVRIPYTLVGSPPKLMQLLGEIERPVGGFVLKPCDQFSGFGISFFSDLERLKTHLQIMDDVSKDWVVQSRIDGTLFSLSCFISNGDVVQALAVDEFVSQSYGGVWVQRSSYPSSMPNEVLLDAREQVRSLVKTQGLVDGLLHVQFIRSDLDGVPYFIEAMRRLPGDFYGFHFDDGKAYHRNYVAPYLPSGVSPWYSDVPLSPCERRVVTRSDLNGVGAFITTSPTSERRPTIFPVGSVARGFEGFNEKVAIVFS